ncbi:MAG: hypothetical protein V9F04_15540 [Dermatophilaceae bacterium]
MKDAALAALARTPGRPAKERDWQLEAARAEIGQLTEAIKAQAIELAVIAGKVRLGLSGPLPARVPAEVKELVLKTVDDAVAGGFAHSWACSIWMVSDDRVHRWRARRRTARDARGPGPRRRSGARDPARRDRRDPRDRRGVGHRLTGRTASSPTGAPTPTGCGCRRRRSGVSWLLTAWFCPTAATTDPDGEEAVA